MWAIDASNRTVLVNRSMSAMLGYTPEEMLGKSMFDFMDEDGERIAAQNVERRRAGISEAHEFVFLNRSGKRVWTRLTTNPIEDQQGRYQGALALVVDITQERAQASEREQLWLIRSRSSIPKIAREPSPRSGACFRERRRSSRFSFACAMPMAPGARWMRTLVVFWTTLPSAQWW